VRIANVVHNHQYDYSRTTYTLANEKVEIVCKEHGIFKQKANNHLNGKGCPKCKESKGETIIRVFLENNNIYYEKEKTFPDCVYKSNLKFDFYLPEKNTCIEYDGIQHYHAIDFFGGEVNLEQTKIKDAIKTHYCVNKNIHLIRISYIDKNNIKKILNQLK
jgi:hypothetical protein